MEKITIIYGPAQSGKTRLASDIAKGKNALWLNGRNYFKSRSNFKLQELTEETELIIIEDIPQNFALQSMYEFADRSILYFKRGHASLFEIQRPKMIFVLDVAEFKFPTGASIDARFDFIKLESLDDYFKEREKLFGRSGKTLTEVAISHIKQATQP